MVLLYSYAIPDADDKHMFSIGCISVTMDDNYSSLADSMQDFKDIRHEVERKAKAIYAVDGRECKRDIQMMAEFMYLVKTVSVTKLF